MKIILLEDVRSVGKKFDVKEVADGYARNFLFVNHLAEPATPSALKKIQEIKAGHEKEDKEMRMHLEGIARKLTDTKLEFSLAADESGKLFGSINKESILKALRDHGFVTTERPTIDLKYPIKDIGEHTVNVGLKKGVTAKLVIVVKKIPH